MGSFLLSFTLILFFSLTLIPLPLWQRGGRVTAEHDPPLQWALVPEGVGLRKGSGNLGKNEILTHYLRICFTVVKMCAWKRNKCLALYNILPVKRNSYLFYVFERSLPCSPMLQYGVNILKYCEIFTEFTETCFMVYTKIWITKSVINWALNIINNNWAAIHVGMISKGSCLKT